MRRQNDLGSQRLGSVHRGVEVVDLEPQRGAVPIRPRRGITDLPVVVLDVKRMELENELPVVQEALILAAPMPALTPEKLLVEATAQLDVADGDQRLRTHRGSV